MNLPPDGFEDGPPDGFADQPTTTQDKPSIMPFLKGVAQQTLNSPIGLGQRVMDAGTSLFNKFGQRTAEDLSQKGFVPNPITSMFSGEKPIPVSPQVAAGVGTAVQMAPDIISAAAVPSEPTYPEGTPKADFIGNQSMGRGMPDNLSPMERIKYLAQGKPETVGAEPMFNLREGPRAGSTVMKPTLNEMGVQPVGEPAVPNAISTKAQDFGVNALGYGKGALKTPQNVARARQTAQTMLDEGIITPFASHEKMAQRASELADTSGEAIGQYLKSVGQRGKFFDPNQAIQSIEDLRPTNEEGTLLKGGLYDKLNGRIDQAVQTIQAHGDKPISFEDANKLKGILQDNANWKSNKDATLLDRVIAGKFRESLDNALEGISNTGQNKSAYADFLANKKTYSAAMQAQDPLYNRISSHLANNGVSLTDFILAAPELAAGNPTRALSLMGGRRLLQGYGSQIGATALNSLSKTNFSGNATRILSPLSNNISKRILKERP